jgi:DNA-binding GntR family transcriptional regulator
MARASDMFQTTRRNLSNKDGGTATFLHQAYQFVKTRIMNRDLKPNQFLTDGQIAKELHISRTPVREALQLLEHEGLLVRQAKRGWKVHSLALKDIHEIFDVKETLESMIAGRAAECKDEAKRSKLRKLMERMKKAAAARNHEAWREADLELHQTIFDMGGNDRASRVINDLNAQWYRVRIGLIAMEERVERSIREHEAIVSSILARKPDEAEDRMRTHLNNLRHELERVLVNLVLPFAESGI